MRSGQSSPVESSDGACLHGDDATGASSNSKKLWRGMQAVYLVLVKKHQPKLAALGVHLHSLLSSSKRRGHRRSRLAALEREQNPALMYLSCRSMDPAAAVVHPYPRGHGHGHRRASSRHAAPSSLSCRSMDPAAAVCRYQYRPREVEFSCKSTPMHKRRREDKRRRRLQQSRAALADQGQDHDHPSSAAAVTRLFALMDVEEVAEGEEADVVVGYDDGDLDPDLDAAATWPALAAVGYAPRPVRITDSPYLAREEDNEGLKSAVDRRADEFIMWFHEQLRTQQQQRSTRNWIR
ncbi:hypothetical protein BDA96_09G213500 [Sorghum bicolor]|uniref:Uncharacterized protein n=2 Tax=Sorghum bicolor TaxID=4558 RepID=A0A921QD37_SORBI|nr:uncharacterized protein LOC8068944 [Sorghum bicolor]EES18527.1 hypothetical protein SORBI_3009G202400 [Sorghum bicolor]KAG0518855.1 hypothetical protein BDA96_09G213500 [Sorghum bicolor]|eukprot:XP_002440097.1 uncharacterized protein LOC8068944 [Sorghum bicolor]